MKILIFFQHQRCSKFEMKFGSCNPGLRYECTSYVTPYEWIEMLKYCGANWMLDWDQEVTGSNPLTITTVKNPHLPLGPWARPSSLVSKPPALYGSPSSNGDIILWFSRFCTIKHADLVEYRTNRRALFTVYIQCAIGSAVLALSAGLTMIHDREEELQQMIPISSSAS